LFVLLNLRAESGGLSQRIVRVVLQLSVDLKIIQATNISTSRPRDMMINEG
jgi:hypothetical protein